MSDRKPPPHIREAPSLEDIMRSSERVGRVDFGSRFDDDDDITPAPPPEPERRPEPVRARPAVVPLAAVEPAPDPEPAVAPAPAPDPTPSEVPGSVAEVAAAVIASMRAVGEAHERHLASLEEEAARRCELLMAQAELDAELIRLHGRREAHTIVSSARQRTSQPATPAQDREGELLNEIGETFSRFAESIETAVDPDAGDPDHPW